MSSRNVSRQILLTRSTVAAAVIVLGLAACGGSVNDAGAEEDVRQESTTLKWPSIPTAPEGGGGSYAYITVVNNGSVVNQNGNTAFSRGVSCVEGEPVTYMGQRQAVSGPACGGTIPKWTMQHMNLLVAMLQAGMSIDQTTLLAGATITLSSAAALRDRGYRVRGVLEQINATPESKSKLDTVVSKLSPTPAPVMYTGAELTRCGGALQNVAGGGTVRLNVHWLSAYPSTPANPDGWTLNNARTALVSAFSAPGNDYISCGTLGINDRVYFDPTTSPDGFGTRASSGSCQNYAPSPISSNQFDSRFATAGCNPETGQNCAACNLDGEAGCSSRVVWRRVGSSSGWRCRAM